MLDKIIQGVQGGQAAVEDAESLFFQLPLLQEIHQAAAEPHGQKAVGKNGNAGVDRQPDALQGGRQLGDILGRQGGDRH